jgi:hypothetical protein
MSQGKFHLRLFQVLSVSLFLFFCGFMVFVSYKVSDRQSGKTGQDTAEMMHIRAKLVTERSVEEQGER